MRTSRNLRLPDPGGGSGGDRVRGVYVPKLLRFFVEVIIDSTFYIEAGNQFDVSNLIKPYYMGPEPLQNRAYFATYKGNFIGFLSATPGPKYHLFSQAEVQLIKGDAVKLYEFSPN